ncbi:MAG: hypothetical protein ACC645_23700 [Pirellulales bacterium]
MNSRWLVTLSLAAWTTTAVSVGLAKPLDKNATTAEQRHGAREELPPRPVGDRSGPLPSRVASQPAPAKPYTVETVEGRVVWLANTLAKRFGVQVVPEATERLLALESTQGRLDLILEDVRGRAFRVDPRLREMTVRLLVRRYRNVPLIQIVDVHEMRDGDVYAIDYWCDVCAIPMFETGPCSCCQAPNRLRKRRVDERP